MNHSQGTLLYLPLAVVHLCRAIHFTAAYLSAADRMAAGNSLHMTAIGQPGQNNIPACVATQIKEGR